MRDKRGGNMRGGSRGGGYHGYQSVPPAREAHAPGPAPYYPPEHVIIRLGNHELDVKSRLPLDLLIQLMILVTGQLTTERAQSF